MIKELWDRFTLALVGPFCEKHPRIRKAVCEDFGRDGHCRHEAFEKWKAEREAAERDARIQEMAEAMIRAEDIRRKGAYR